MILVGNQRGGARDLAQHLMKPDNERVEVHELRGFVAQDLDGAFRESYAISRGTQCTQFLFSLSLNPPKGADVSTDQFMAAVNKAESKLGLKDQPRAVVFHDKRGDDGEMRRHAHAVWSRIKVEEMKAVHMSKSHEKLQDVARDLYLEHGWTMPRGLAKTGERDPRNFTLEEWQQAKRTQENPREIKAAFLDAWAISDSKTAFTHALQERGYWLCRGDKRGFVAVDRHGEVRSVPKMIGIKTKEVRERLGEPDKLASVADTKIEIARAMQKKMEDFRREVREREERQAREAKAKGEALKARQQKEQEARKRAAEARRQQEAQERRERLRKGVMGFWDRLTGKRKRTIEQNNREAEVARKRDIQERQTQTAVHLAQRKKVVQERTQQRTENKTVTRSLTEDAKVFQAIETDAAAEREARKAAFKESRRKAERPRRRSRQRSRDGPEPGF